MSSPRARRLIRRATVVALAGAAVILVLVAGALALLDTGWSRDQIRQLIVGQSQRFLQARLEIDALDGSLWRGVRLVGVRVMHGGQTVIKVREISLAYSLRELFGEAVRIRALRLVEPQIVAQRGPDGAWNLGAIVRRDRPREPDTRPSRAVRVESLGVVDATITLRESLAFGAARISTRYEALNASLTFESRPAGWHATLADVSFVGEAPDLVVTRLAGSLSSGEAGVVFDNFSVTTPRSAFTLNGLIQRQRRPPSLDLRVEAQRFAFQEWGGILEGLKTIAVDAAFNARLEGPLSKLATTLDLESNGGGVAGSVILDTTVPGWEAKGSVDLTRLDLARWLNRPDRPSDISGRLAFDLNPLLRRFPTGSFAFDGSHAAFLGYEADRLRLRGTTTASEVRIGAATATAYGSTLRIDKGSIGSGHPYGFHFEGRADGVDLRHLPASVPVPHVETTLNFLYDLDGRFAQPFVLGRAEFDDSEFLGASVAAGTIGTLDTLSMPVRYTGDGAIAGVALERFATELAIGWLMDPRYRGQVGGRFSVEGQGGDTATLQLRAGGQLAEARLFGGTFSGADVGLEIRDGSLTATYDGSFAGINPGEALADRRFDASLSGSGRARIGVHRLLQTTPGLRDITIESRVSLQESQIRGARADIADVTFVLSDGTLDIVEARISGPMLEGTGSGRIELDGTRSSRFEYDLPRVDLSRLGGLVGRPMAGQAATRGTLTGPTGLVQLTGDADVRQLDLAGIQALTARGHYEVDVRPDAREQTAARIDGRATLVQAFGRELREADGRVSYESPRLEAKLRLADSSGLEAVIDGTARIGAPDRRLDLTTLTIGLRGSTWSLVPSEPPPAIVWDEAGFDVSPLTLTSGTPEQQIGVGGSWRQDGSGALQITARGVSLDAFDEAPARFGGTLTLDAVLRGTRDVPIVTGEIAIVEGRVRRLTYERLGGRVTLSNGSFDVDVRLDQAPGLWLTAAGRVPLALLDRTRPEEPLDVTITSSPIALGLIEGVTRVVREVTGDVQLNVHVIGTSRDPHFTGLVAVSGAGFVVASTGARYRNGRVLLQLTRDRVTVDTLQLEDAGGQLLDLKGSLGTHELKVGDLEIDVRARQFEVLRNEFGTVDVDADVQLRGRFETPRIAGRVVIAGGELKIDRLLDRVLFRPYATTARAAPDAEVDALAALNPWERLGLDLAVRVPGTLRLTGDNVQVAEGTPLGLGSFNLRVTGEPYLYKDPGGPMYVTGSLDQVTGTYAFQGRRFELDPNSSINFRGDLNPEPFVMVERVISGVETRVTIAGTLAEPELRFSSTPPLESSDILSLIVFNTPVNQLSAEQQGQLAARAVTLGAGFLATPLINALERSLGIDTLEIAAGDFGTGARVTIGDEIAPGLVARFSRQFGRDEYDEATLEYYLSRIFRIRATFSDAGTLIARSPFRRVERAGVDFILFFSF